MGHRLFLFLIVLMLTMVLGVIVILLLNGTFAAGLNENEKLIQNELHHIFQDVSEYYGQLSVQAVSFSKDLALDINENLQKKGLSTNDLHKLS